MAIVAQDDDGWRSLAALLGEPELAELGLEERLAQNETIEALVSDWTADKTAADVESLCQDEGVAAHRVQNSPELIADPQLLHRHHFCRVAHSIHGTVPIEGPRFSMSRSPPGP